MAANPEFHAENPAFSEFLSKYRTSSQLTSEGLAYISENDASYRDAARWFLGEHDDLLDEWLAPDKAELVRIALK